MKAHVDKAIVCSGSISEVEALLHEACRECVDEERCENARLHAFRNRDGDYKQRCTNCVLILGDYVVISKFSLLILVPAHLIAGSLILVKILPVYGFHVKLVASSCFAIGYQTCDHPEIA